jgi:hypothetical protein
MFDLQKFACFGNKAFIFCEEFERLWMMSDDA